MRLIWLLIFFPLLAYGQDYNVPFVPSGSTLSDYAALYDCENASGLTDDETGDFTLPTNNGVTQEVSTVKFGSGSCAFDGTDDMRATNATWFSYDGTSSFTWGVHFYKTTTNDNVVMLGIVDNSGAASGAEYYLRSNSGGADFYQFTGSNGTSNFNADTPSAALNQWVCAVVSYDAAADQVEFYYGPTDATYTATSITSIASTSTVFVFGDDTGGSNDFTGFMDEMAHWTRKLTSTEIDEYCTTGAP